MRLLLVDDEVIALKSMEAKINKCIEDVEIFSFVSPKKALEWMSAGNNVHAALIDINMAQMDGLTLATNIKMLYPDCIIVFVTGYTEYALKAFSVKASGYLVKPVNLEDLKLELNYIRQTSSAGQPQVLPSPDTDLYVHCFGDFDVFAKGKPVHFRRQKSKEIFAYLVDRKGASVTMPELASVLWEDGVYNTSRNRQLHTFIHDLILDFEDCGYPDIVQKSRNNVSVDVSRFTCDYYDYISGTIASINSFIGEYMSQYSWAEITVAKLTEQPENYES